MHLWESNKIRNILLNICNNDVKKLKLQGLHILSLSRDENIVDSTIDRKYEK